MIYEPAAATAAAAPRARRRDANLGRILDAAARLVADDGLDALSMARLAEAVDYTAGALYRYVDSKDALLSLLVIRVVDDLRAGLAAAVAALPPPASPLDRVAAMVRAYRELVVREPHRYGVLAITLATPRVLLPVPTQAAPVAAAVIATLQPLADALVAATAAGQLEPGDPVERTLALFAMLHGLAQLPKLTHHVPGAFDVERLIRAGTRALLVGWGARPAAVDAALGPSSPHGKVAPTTAAAAPSPAAARGPATSTRAKVAAAAAATASRPTRRPPSRPTSSRPRRPS